MSGRPAAAPRVGRTTPTRLGVHAALVDGVALAGDVELADGRVAAVGLSPAGARGLAVPGFVDLQVNGFAGVDFLGADPDAHLTAAGALAAVGVTAYQPTLITAPPATLRDAVASAAAARERAPLRMLGVHLEGPFLSPRWPGAHPSEHLLPPDLTLVDELTAAGPVAAVTLAPELPGGLELIEALAARGLNVRIGHTDADAATAHAAFDRGASALTHVHNAHRRFSPRDPGPAGAALTRDDVRVTAIVDGVHLADETVELVRRVAGARLCLVSDAIAAAGLGDGRFRFGEMDVAVSNGRSARADGTLSGSVSALDAAVRRLVAGGTPLAAAVHAATRAPALLAGRADLGRLAPGAPADLAVLDDDLTVTRTLVGGAERFAA